MVEVICTFTDFFSNFRTILNAVFYRHEIRLDDYITLTVPLAMFLLTPAPIAVVFKLWLVILTVASYCFAFIASNAGHHHPSTVHDGDKLNDDTDWGLYQLDALMDRTDIKGSLFLELTHFGNHALHHYFPTVDHALLEEFNDLLYETCKEFKTHLVEKPWPVHIIGQHMQMARNQPHTEVRVVRTKSLMM
jgi:fatty acid desaturase